MRTRMHARAHASDAPLFPQMYEAQNQRALELAKLVEQRQYQAGLAMGQHFDFVNQRIDDLTESLGVAGASRQVR